MWIAVLLMIVPAGMAADSTAVRESKGKALFLVNFVKYVDWPRGVIESTNSPVIIGLVGDCDVEADLKAIAKGTAVAGHPLIIKTFDGGDDVKGCHILFILDGESRNMASLLDRLKGTATLTVSDAEKFTAAGGMISLVPRNNRIRPQVNLSAAEGSGLKLSSKLLSVSDVMNAPSSK